jgi:hypothetical protein
MTTRATTSSPWSLPVELVEINTGQPGIGRPQITDDLLTIYMEGVGLGTGDDIWFSHRASTTDAFDPPQRLTAVNSTLDDEDPWVSPDQRTLLLSSARSGQYLIWESTR